MFYSKLKLFWTYNTNASEENILSFAEFNPSPSSGKTHIITNPQEASGVKIKANT